MVGAKGPGRGSSGDRLHHRSLHFDIPAGVEKATDRLEHQGAFDEDLAHIDVHEEIDIALAVAQFHVGQAVILLRQGQHRFGQKRDGFHMDGELAGPGAEDVAGDADVVSQVQQLVELKALFSHGIQANIDLQPFAALLQLGEAGLALGADGHDAPGDRDHGPLRVERSGGISPNCWRTSARVWVVTNWLGYACWPSAAIWRSLSLRSAKRLLSNSDSNNGTPLNEKSV